MFDKSCLEAAITRYKEEFVSSQWCDEKYKWEAIKCFQDNWDVNASDFADMLTRSLAKTSNLMASKNNFPASMIQKFAQTAPEEVRAIFIALFNESSDVVDRIIEFKEKSCQLLEKYGSDSGSHYQHENAISTYLWLRYPDKYYIYKYGEVKKVADELKSNYSFKKGAYVDNMRNFYSFYDELCEEVKKDSELLSLFKSQVANNCYPDPAYKTLVIDVGFYISRSKPKQDEWFPADYSPGITVDNWLELLNNKDIFTPSSLEIMKRIKHYGGQATCKQLAVKYGESNNFYNTGSSSLARRIAKSANCPVIPDEDSKNSRWWPILYVGKYADNDEDGIYIWKLREELAQALDLIDLSQVKLFVIDDEEENPILAEKGFEKYTKASFLAQVYITENRYDILVSVLKNKKNIILQGAPGVGKTFAAKRLAYSMMGEKDDNRIEFVQFHQNYSYEDFMMGYKPNKDGFELKQGVFYRFCQKAANQPDKEHFFIIDEINRGNMSKIFGELLMLIERNYRGTKATLAYTGLSFTVPKNVYIIGMMNTADRSLAMIDYALRRRFSFFDMEPGFDSEGFIEYQDALNDETLSLIITRVKELNKEITLDRSLGKGFCIGHSYFCDQSKCSEEWLQSIIEYEILPMLSEYWFDDMAKLQRWENNLRGVFQ